MVCVREYARALLPCDSSRYIAPGTCPVRARSYTPVGHPTPIFSDFSIWHARRKFDSASRVRTISDGHPRYNRPHPEFAYIYCFSISDLYRLIKKRRSLPESPKSSIKRNSGIKRNCISLYKKNVGNKFLKYI